MYRRTHPFPRDKLIAQIPGRLCRGILQCRVSDRLITKDPEDGTQQETIEADMYVWNGDMAEPSPEPWDLELYVEEPGWWDDM